MGCGWWSIPAIYPRYASVKIGTSCTRLVRAQDLCGLNLRGQPVAPSLSITVLVHEYANGDKAALDGPLPLVFAELRRIAQKHLQGERQGHTLQPTALVHEMYGRLAGQAPPDVRDRNPPNEPRLSMLPFVNKKASAGP